MMSSGDVSGGEGFNRDDFSDGVEAGESGCSVMRHSRDEPSGGDGVISDNDSLSGNFRHVRRSGTTRRGKAVSKSVCTEAAGN